MGEIEARLGGLEGVKEAVVVAREHGAGDQRLVAYYTGAKTWEVAELRAALGAGLPEYMVPTAYVKLEALPLTANGKVERRALPAPEAGAFGSGAYEPPVGPVEERLAEIWREVLRAERVGRQDNFFARGGHSLLAVTVAERMRRVGLASDVRALFTAPTLAALAAQAGTAPDEIAVPPNLIPAGAETITPEMVTLVGLDQQAIDTIVAAVPGGAANVQDIYPLAPLQEGILFHHLVQREGDPYQLAIVLRLDREEEVEELERTLQVLVERHDILRTAVVWEGLDEPVQVVLRRARIEMARVVAEGGAGSAEEQLRRLCDPRRQRMDIRRAPLLRGYVAKDGEGWVVLLQAHHLAIDHATLERLVDECRLIDAGEDEELSAPVSYREVVGRARLALNRDEQAVYFTNLLSDVDEPTAPYGLMEARGDGSRVMQARRRLGDSAARRVREQARRLGVSTASVMHLAWALVLGRLTGRDDVVFGTVLLGRMQAGPGAERLIGMLINTLPARVKLARRDVATGVRQVQAQLTELLRHEHASLALAQRCSGVAAPAPLFTALLNYRHTPAELMAELNEHGERELSWTEERTNYPVSVDVDDEGTGFVLTVQVSEGEKRAERVCGYLERAIAGVVEALEEGGDKPLRAVEVLGEAERWQVVEGWSGKREGLGSGRCVHELIEEVARREPEKVAVWAAG
ncbi:MAG TPA: condensation domain-containing protein, partial [Polyangia bacterium]|nr:condensation domain-containing protein [Polyangia bacterium]